jgi:thioredoxin 2
MATSQAVREISDQDFEELVNSGQPVFVDFWAPWCGPCKVMAPEFERAAARLEPRIRLVKVNVDEEPELANRYGIRSIPTMALLSHGKELGRRAGAMSAADLERWVASVRPA